MVIDPDTCELLILFGFSASLPLAARHQQMEINTTITEDD